MREWGRKGGKKRAEAFTPEYQRMARSHVKRESLQASGHKGFIATGGKIGWKRANRKAADWRIAHPSEPERWALSVLESAGLNHFVREHEPFKSNCKTVDIAWPDEKVCIEVNGHQSKPSFGETTPRVDKQAIKIRGLRRAGWKVLVVDATGDREQAAAQLIEFVKRNTKQQTPEQDEELPF